MTNPIAAAIRSSFTSTFRCTLAKIVAPLTAALLATSALNLPAQQGVPSLVPHAARPDATARVQSANRVQAKAELLKRPLAFEQDHAPGSDGMSFVSRGHGYSVLLSGSESTFVTVGDPADTRGRSVHMQLGGANAKVKPRAEKPLPGKSNYLLGNNPSRWMQGVDQYQQVRLADVYPGIDLLYYGNQRQVEHDFIVSPGTDPSQIRMQFSDTTSPRIDLRGDLELKIQQGATVLFEKPVAYQTAANGTRHSVTADYATLSDRSIGFRIGAYDRSLPLIIDPVVITYSTYFGGNDQDSVVDLKLDAAGNIYVLMSTDSTDLPVVSQIAGGCIGTCGPANPDTLSSGLFTTTRDFYLAKLDPTGQTLLFSTYIGGSGDDVPGALSLSSDGSIYIAGETQSTDFPLVNQYSSTLASTVVGYSQYFSTTMTRLSADGSRILYSSLIGGGLINFGGNNGGRYWGTSTGSIAAGPNGIAYLLGSADSEGGGFGNFVDAKNTSFLNGDGTFLAKFDTTKTGPDSLVYATTFGQPGDQGSENLWSIGLDSKQNVWVFGNGGYGSPPIPTANALQPICGGGGQCGNTFLFELSPAGGIIYATFLGGTTNPYGGPVDENALSLYIDPADNIYLTGGTNAIDFPTKNGATPTSTTGGGFLTKLSPGALSIVYSTYTPISLYVTATSGGMACGVSASAAGFPVKNGLNSQKAGPTYDAVFQIYDTTQSGDASLIASSYLGSTFYTIAQTTTFDAAGNLLFAGYTESGGLPLVNPYQATCSGGCYNAGNYYPDGFISRIQVQNSGGLSLLPATQSFGSSQVGISSPALTSTLTNTGTLPITLSGGSLSETEDFGTSNNCGSILGGGASCTVSFVFKPTSAGPFTGTFSIYDLSNPDLPVSVALSGTGVTAQMATLTPSTVSFGDVAVQATSLQKVTLTNTGSQSLAITSATLSGIGFTQTTTCGASLAVGASCTYSITFAPTTAGPATGTLTIVDAAGTQTVALTANGVAPTVTLTPTSYNFGNVTIGTTGLQNFTLTSTNSAPLGLQTYSVTGPGFSLPPFAPNPCPSSQPGTCVFEVQFFPTVAGPATGTLTIVDAAGTQTVALTANGVAPTVTLTPTSYNFGNVTIGTTGLQNFTLTSTSSAPLGLQTYSVTGPGFSLPPFAPNPCPSSQPGTCVFEVQFFPTVAGPATGTLTIVDAAGTQTVALTANGVAPTVTLTPTSYNFGNVTIGTTGLQNFTLTSTSSAALGLQTYSVTGPGFSLPPFAPNPCPSSQPGTCVFEVQFFPTTAGPATGTLTIVDAAGTQTVALTANGVAPTVTLTPTSYNFGNVTIGTAGLQNFTLTSTSSAALGLQTYSVTGPGFSLPPFAPNPCPSSQPGTCVFEVQFFPTTAGPATGTLTIVDAAGTQTVALTANGVAPTVTLTPTSYNFGNVTIGTAGLQNFTLTSTSSAALGLQTYSVTGPGFSLPPFAPNPCPSSQPGTCVFEVQFFPTVAGPATGTLTIVDAAGTQTVALSGTGTTPTLTLTPTSYNYGNVTVGTTSTQTFTLTSNSSTSLGVTNYTVSGAGFAITPFSPNPCSTTLPQTCVFAVQFAPKTAGPATGTLTIVDAAGTQTVALSGTGTAPPDFTLTAPTNASIKVFPGSTGTLVFQVGSTSTTNPYTSPITFSTSDLPANAFAFFTPVTVTPGAAGTSTTLTIGVLSSAQNKPSPIFPRDHETAFGISAAALLGGLMCLRRKRPARLLILLCTLGLIGGMVGCGSSTEVPITTSNVIVTATSGSISHTISVTLTIE